MEVEPGAKQGFLKCLPYASTSLEVCFENWLPGHRLHGMIFG